MIDDVFQCNRPEFRNYKVTNSSKGLFEVLDQTHVILYPLRSQHSQFFLPAVLKIIIIIIIKSLLNRKGAQQTCAFTIPIELNYNYND